MGPAAVGERQSAREAERLSVLPFGRIFDTPSTGAALPLEGFRLPKAEPALAVNARLYSLPKAEPAGGKRQTLQLAESRTGWR